MINRYDVPLQLDNVNPITAILTYIVPGMEILEMGPAFGRLTRYLSEKKGCRVSIVEIDKISFNHAMQYAVDGICADIDKNDWYDYYSTRKFDAIIFADVIEHLNKPKEVIEKAKSLLKEGGKILFSVPNVAHNGVIAQLINNNFKYTETGILDYTHVKFYTYYSFHELMEQCGMVIYSEKAIYQDTKLGGWHDFDILDEKYKELLSEREFSDVLEFVFASVTNEWYQTNKDQIEIERITAFKGTTTVSSLYYDCGEGFNQQNYMQSTMFIKPDGSFSVTFDLRNIENIKMLRFDPCDFECKIQLYTVNGKFPEQITALNNYIVKNKIIYFYTKDPNFLITDTRVISEPQLIIEGKISKIVNDELLEIINDQKVVFDGTILQERLKYERACKELDLLNEALNKKKKEVEQAESQLENIRKQYKDACKELGRLNELLADKNKEIEALDKIVSKKDDDIHKANEQIIALRNELGRLNELLADKNKEIEALDKIVSKKDDDIHKANEQIIALRNELDNLSVTTQQLLDANQQLLDNLSATNQQLLLAYNDILNSTCWKITKPLRVLLDNTKRFKCKSIAGFRKSSVLLTKTIRYLGQFGLKATVRKIRYKIFKGAIRPESYINAGYNIVSDCSETLDTGKSVSIVIPTKNAGVEFELLLKNLTNQKGFSRIEIIVVDSGSTDNTVNISRKYGAKIIQIKPEEFSHSYSRNLGAENASCEYLCVMTQDALPSSLYWLYNLYQAMNSEPNIAAVSCVEYPRADSDLYHRAFVSNHYKYLGANNKDIIMTYPNDSDYDSVRKNGQLSDITCFIKRETLLKYKYRGEFAEDLDLGMRLISDGYQLAFLGNEVSIHSHNRPPYYYLKRWFVDLITLKKIFPDYPVIETTLLNAIKETVFVAFYLSRLLDGFKKNNKIFGFMVFRELFFDKYQDIKQKEYPLSSLIRSDNFMLHFDDMTKSFIQYCVNEYMKMPIKDGERYKGLMLDSLEGHINVVFKYMEDCYELIDNEVINEFIECISKTFAGIIGTYIGYSYLTSEDDRSKYEDFYRMFGVGV